MRTKQRPPGTREYRPTFWWWLVSVVVMPAISAAVSWHFKGREIEVSERRVTIEAAGLLDDAQPERSLAALVWMAKSGDPDVAIALANTSALLLDERGLEAGAANAIRSYGLLNEIYLAVLRRSDVPTSTQVKAMASIAEMLDFARDSVDRYRGYRFSVPETIAEIGPRMVPIADRLIHRTGLERHPGFCARIAINTLKEINNAEARDALWHCHSNYDGAEMTMVREEAGKALVELGYATRVPPEGGGHPPEDAGASVPAPLPAGGG